jgi:chorismate mutase/prephenate dehydratase
MREYYVQFLSGNMAISRAYQERLINGMKAAYSGTRGAFAHIATSRFFPTAQAQAYPDFAAAYQAVVSGECDVAVLPTENSYNGEVGQVTDLMFSGPLYVDAIAELPVTQDLRALPGATMADIKKVVSHPQALGQCAEYIKEKGFETREYSNTALAAEYVAEKGKKSIAAIASAEAAELFGLTVLERNINASRTNTTKFAVFSRADNTFPIGNPMVDVIKVMPIEGKVMVRSADGLTTRERVLKKRSERLELYKELNKKARNLFKNSKYEYSGFYFEFLEGNVSARIRKNNLPPYRWNDFLKYFSKEIKIHKSLL